MSQFLNLLNKCVIIVVVLHLWAFSDCSGSTVLCCLKDKVSLRIPLSLIPRVDGLVLSPLHVFLASAADCWCLVASAVKPECATGEELGFVDSETAAGFQVVGGRLAPSAGTPQKSQT